MTYKSIDPTDDTVLLTLWRDNYSGLMGVRFNFMNGMETLVKKFDGGEFEFLEETVFKHDITYHRMGIDRARNEWESLVNDGWYVHDAEPLKPNKTTEWDAGALVMDTYAEEILKAAEQQLNSGKTLMEVYREERNKE
jgi:hypothetical protein